MEHGERCQWSDAYVKDARIPIHRDAGEMKMERPITSMIGLIALAMLAMLLPACRTTPTVLNDLPPLAAECRTPIKVAVVIDESTSMSTSGTAPVKADELRPLIDALANCGGTLGVGFVREAPQPGLARIEFPRRSEEHTSELQSH